MKILKKLARPFAPLRTLVARVRLAHLNRQVNGAAADLADALAWQDRCELHHARLVRARAYMACHAASEGRPIGSPEGW